MSVSDKISIGSLPQLVLPGPGMTISNFGEYVGIALAARGDIYRRGDSLVRLEIKKDGRELRLIKTAALPSMFEGVATLCKPDREGALVPSICSETTARLVSAADSFLEPVPEIIVLSDAPVLVKRDERLVEIIGYDRQTGILAGGEATAEMTVAEARDLLLRITADFKFASPSDHSRAISLLLAPAIVRGGLLPSNGRTPYYLIEADASQTGKGYLVKIMGAIHRTIPATVTQKKGGVGGLEESFDTALIRGHSIILLDNLRGSLDSPKLESFATELNYMARQPYSGDVPIDPRRTFVVCTSNRAELTVDFANRTCRVGILKQEPGYAFHEYAEGDLLDHLGANQNTYLGAVHSILRAWYAGGEQRTKETRHEFRPWAGAVDWMIQHLLKMPPLLDGHREVQQRMASPAINWVRDVALAVARAGQLPRSLTASDIMDLIVDDPSVETPGLANGQDITEESTKKAVRQAIGRKLAAAFKTHGAEEVVLVDTFAITRTTEMDDQHGRELKRYRFASTRENGVSPDDQQVACAKSPLGGNPRAERFTAPQMRKEEAL